MRFRGDRKLDELPLRLVGVCVALGLLTSCGGVLDRSVDSVPQAPLAPRANGPQADFPILIGAPYEVNGVAYTPADRLNYDEVGHAVLDDATMGVTGSHHTLPVPSYVEVTSLETGRTILVRLERRGPMTSNDLIALSPAAFGQLGAESSLAVRVRRVNPPEEQRALLRAGQSAALRMDTPMSLVEVLRRDLPKPSAVMGSQTVEPYVAIAPEPAPAPDVVMEAEVLPELPDLDAPPMVESPVEVTPVSPALKTEFFVQAAAFSTQERADRAANAIDGNVIPGGRFFLLRTGPFATREEAAASLAKVRAAGYDDARILESD